MTAIFPDGTASKLATRPHPLRHATGTELTRGQQANRKDTRSARRLVEPAASGQSRDACFRSWAKAEGLHTGQAILDALDARFSDQHISFGAYFFTDLSGTSETDQQAAIDAGRIRPTASIGFCDVR